MLSGNYLWRPFSKMAFLIGALSEMKANQFTVAYVTERKLLSGKYKKNISNNISILNL